MNILAITARRVEKLQEPMEILENTTCITVADLGLFKRYFTIISSGIHVIRRDSPDVILVDGGDVTGFLTLILGSLFRIPVVVRLGGDPWTARAQERKYQIKSKNYTTYMILSVLYLLNKFTYRSVDGFIVVSDELKQVTERHTPLPSSEIQVVPQHIDPGSFEKQSQKDPRISQSDTKLLTVTNFRFKDKYQGVLDIIEEIKPLLEQKSDIYYIVAGSGMYLKKLKEDLRDPSLSSVRDQIHILGYVDDINEIYDDADVFIYISYLDGYPNVILEAQASQLPVVANAAHGMLMQIDEGETGFLIDPSVPGQCRSRVQYLLNNPEDASRLGTQAARRVRKKNSVEQIAQKLHDGLVQIVFS